MTDDDRAYIHVTKAHAGQNPATMAGLTLSSEMLRNAIYLRDSRKSFINSSYNLILIGKAHPGKWENPGWLEVPLNSPSRSSTSRYNTSTRKS